MAFYRKKVITFFINEECNMKCIYCTIHSDRSPTKDSPRVIDPRFARRGIDDYFNNDFFLPGEKKGIRIFSNGESTMEFERMRGIVDYARSRVGNDLFVEMQTNGYFSEKIARWIGENVDLAWVSLDGTAGIQNRQRPTTDGQDSFAVIDRNIKVITKSDKTKIGLRPTISEYNLGRQKELINYALENRIASVCADPWGCLTEVKGKPELMRFAREFLKAWSYARRRGLPYGTEFIVNFDEETEVYCRSCLPAPQFTPDGHVSSCDMVNTKDGFLPQLFPDLIFGRYDRTRDRIIYNQKHIEKIRSRNIHNLPQCQGCPALKHCAGGCIGIAMSASLDFYGINREYCAITRYLFARMRDIVNTGYDENIPIHP